MQVVKVARRRKPLKIALIFVLSLVAIIAVAIIVLRLFGDRFGLHRVNASQMRTMDFSSVEMYPQSFATDALYLVRFVEENHPIFVLDDWLPDDYEVIRDKFLAYTRNESITQTDFVFAMMEYIVTLRDGHMNQLWYDESDLLDINWQELDGRLFLTGEDGGITSTEVLEIGGVPVSQVFSVIDRYYYSENEAARHTSHSLFSRLSVVVERAGGMVTNDGIQILVSDNGETMTKDITFFERSREREFIIRHEIIDDVFLIDLRTFFADYSDIADTVRYIEDAVAGGTRKFIVDLRGNGGGSSWIGQRLLSAMGITIPQFGALIRTSPVEIEHGGMWHFSILNFLGIDYVTMSPSASSNNPNDVFVSVLTDAASFSSAMWMATWAQDGGFGNVIGSPSRNAPTSFGNVLWHTLPYSGVSLPVSRTQWLRPDENADPLVLMPDILVDPVSAMEVALEYLQNLEN